MNNSSTVLQVWVKALRVNHKSTRRKTNKLLRERIGERSDVHVAPGNITSPPHCQFTPLDEGCGPIMRYPAVVKGGKAWRKVAPALRSVSEAVTRWGWRGAKIPFRVPFSLEKWHSLDGSCEVKSSLPCVIWNHHHSNLNQLFPGGQCSSITLTTAAELINMFSKSIFMSYISHLNHLIFEAVLKRFNFVYSHLCFTASPWAQLRLYGHLNHWLCAGFWLARLQCFALTFNGLYKLQIRPSLHPYIAEMLKFAWPPRVVSAHFQANPAALLLWWCTTNKLTAGLKGW